MTAEPAFDDYLDDMILAVADRQTGSHVEPVDLLELHKERFATACPRRRN